MKKKKSKTIQIFKLLVVFIDDEGTRHEIVEPVRAPSEHAARRLLMDHHLAERHTVRLISSKLSA